MNREFEKLIEAIVADGKVTRKEKEVLYKAADRLGIDRETADVLLEGALHSALNEPEVTTAGQHVASGQHDTRSTECGNCGARLEAHSSKCVYCGAEQRFAENTGGDFVKSLQAALDAATREQNKIDNAKSGFKASLEMPGVALARRQAGVISAFDVPTETKAMLSFFLHCDANAEADVAWNRQRGGAEDILKAAWKSKAAMAYRQLELVDSGDGAILGTVERYRSRYGVSIDDVKKTEKARKIKKRILWGAPIGCATFFILFQVFSCAFLAKEMVGEVKNVSSPSGEIRRLADLQEQIQSEIDLRQFDSARTALPKLRYTYPQAGWEEDPEYNARVAQYDEIRREFKALIEKMESTPPRAETSRRNSDRSSKALPVESGETFESSLKQGKPFGLRIGMKATELGPGAELIETTDTGETYYLMEQVPVPDQDFIHYSVELTSNGDMSKVIAAIINGSFLGEPESVDAVYSDWTARLTKILGPKADNPRSVKGLQDMESDLLSAWSEDSGAKLPPTVCRVALFSEVFEDVFEGAFDVGSIPGLVLVVSFENSNHCR